MGHSNPWDVILMDSRVPIGMQRAELCFSKTALRNKTHHLLSLTAATETSLMPTSKWALNEEDLMGRFIACHVFAN